MATSATVAAASATPAATSRRRPSEKPLDVVGASRIAGAPHGHDGQGRAMQLAAQARDIELQCVLGDLVVQAEELVHEALLGDHLAEAAGQDLEQAKLAPAE